MAADAHRMSNEIVKEATDHCKSSTASPRATLRLPSPWSVVPSSSALVKSSPGVSGESCIFADLLEKVPIAFDHGDCSTTGDANLEADYVLLEHIRSGHYDSCCSSLPGNDKNAAIELAPIRMELPFSEVPGLTPTTLGQPLISPRHIRLIVLQPRPGHEMCVEEGFVQESLPLKCDVFQASLDNLVTDGKPLFMALSYACGNQSRLQRIRCGPEDVRIPQNTYDALAFSRLVDRPRLVWVDYLCINQDDKTEKGHQVQMLHKIYAQAHVVCWLGTGYDIDLECVSTYMPLLAHFWTAAIRKDRSLDWREHWRSAVAKLEEYLVAQVTVDLPPFSWEVLASIFASEYFDRIWTVQEAILGKTKTFQIGDALFSVAVLAAAVRMLLLLHDHPLLAPAPEHTSERAWDDTISRAQLEDVWHTYLIPAVHRHYSLGPNGAMRDLNVVLSLHDRSCTDPRDRIYGLTSLFDGSGAYDVDYTLSETEVFANFTVHCLLKSGNADALNYSRLTMESSDSSLCRSDLPTWCPDWSHPFLYTSYEEEQDYCQWRASGAHVVQCSRPSTFELGLKGFIISEVTLCSDSAFGIIQHTPAESLLWLEGRDSLCEFFAGWSSELDSGTLKSRLQIIFKALLLPMGVSLYPINLGRFSTELRQVLGAVGETALVGKTELTDLFMPVYLSKVDPDLFEAAGLAVDPSIPLGDLEKIESVVSMRMSRSSRDTRLFIADDHMLALGYPGVQEGDLVCIIYGSDMPQILRQIGDEGHYILVGTCIVDGLMYGEGLDMGLTEQDFILI